MVLNLKNRAAVKQLTRIALLTAIVLSGAGSALAQEQEAEEFAPAPSVVVGRRVHLRRDPSTRQARIKLLNPSDKLRLLEPQEQSGFYHVITRKGQQGWVWSKNVRYA
jgi:uncharacterized protein YgiM (DUF1202 family)